MKEEKRTKLTSFLNDTLMHAAKNISVDVAKKHFKEVKKVAVYYKNELSKPNPDKFIGKLYAKVDQIVKESVKPGSVSCSKGCSHCCYQAVNISKSKALYILNNTERIELDTKLLVKQLPLTTYQEWHELPYADRKCIFLQDNKCSIYDIRPIACRKYFVKSLPDDCDSQANPNRRVINMTINPVEKMASALINAEENGLLPAMIQKVVQKFK